MKRQQALEKRAQSVLNQTKVVSNNQTAKPAQVSIPQSSKPPQVSQFARQSSEAKAWQNRNSLKKDDKAQPKQWNVFSEPIVGTCSLFSRDRFCANVAYNQKLIDLLKTIPGREFDPVKKIWHFPLEQYQNFKELVAPLAPHIVFSAFPRAIQKNKEKGSWDNIDHKSIDVSRIERNLLDSLFPFQIEGVQFGISKHGRCLIADEMGLGKTIQALGIADYFRSEWPLLIVCPSSMRYQWEEEIRKFIPSVPSYSVYVINSKKDFIERAKVVIISFDLMGKQKDFLKKYGFGVIIVDESHSLKSNKTQRTKAAIEIISNCRRCILLSGTPALSRPSELFPQIKALQPSLFKDMMEFGVRYCEGKQDRFGWNFNGSSNLDELRILLEEKIMIRRLKTDVLDQLPSKIRQVVILSDDNIDNTKTMSVYAKKLNQDSIKGTEKRSTLLSYFAETGKSKIKAICLHIEKLLEQNKKFLCFAHHRDVLDAVCKVLEAKEVYYIRIDGSVNSEERKSVCDQFQEEDKFRVAVLSIKAANTGITLTAAQLIVFAELFWNPGELIQAEDRAHRIGQKDSVLVQYLLAKGTADDYLWPLVQSKLTVLKRAGLSELKELTVNSDSSQVLFFFL
ncbi:hypothetical protein AAG570_014066 [Ranatra chinensis]|uniref:SWI/SNF-related matrix-associated actin-dependent regulator of chromatin subfamily A-like protein 1 n=1 Tax=Ranatra chinensis TaxID=642074 RepID=A0ABD0XS27_9HEMI